MGLEEDNIEEINKIGIEKNIQTEETEVIQEKENIIGHKEEENVIDKDLNEKSREIDTRGEGEDKIHNTFVEVESDERIIEENVVIENVHKNQSLEKEEDKEADKK